MKSILVGANGNDWSRTARDLAIDWAQRTGSHVTFIAILDIDELTAGESTGMMGSSFKADRDQKVVATRRKRLEDALEEAGRKAEAAGIRHDVVFVEGDAAEELGREVQRHDILMIGKRTEPRSDHEPASSDTMTDIVRRSSRPVVVTGPDQPRNESVVVAYDGSPQSSRALESFVGSELFADSPVHVVSVGKDEDEAAGFAQRAHAFLTRHGRNAQVHVLHPEGGVPETIQRFVEQESPSLLVMGVYGKPRLQELLIGSVSKEMLRSIRLPMFLDH